MAQTDKAARGTSAPAETEAPQSGDTHATPAQGSSGGGDQPRAAATATDENDGKVSVKLAHHLGNESDAEKDTLRRLGLDTDHPYAVDAEIRVRREEARTLITAGYAQVDPEDTKAVNEALGLTRPR